MEDTFGIAVGLEVVSLCFKFASQLFEVVYFAVDRKYQIAVIGDKRLVSVFEVDDRQPAVTDDNIIVGKIPESSWPR